MEDEDSFTFYQEDLFMGYPATFRDLKERKLLCDVTIRVDDRSFSAHRLILVAGIPYFREAFIDQKDIFLSEISADALESLIEFAYCSKVEITFQNVRPLMMAAKFLKMEEVKGACCKFLMKRLNPKTALKIRNLSEGSNCLSLIESSERCILENFNELSQSEEFLSLPFSCLENLVSSDELNVESEEKVFEAVIKWAKTCDDGHAVLPALLRHVRLIQLKLSYLVEVVATEELVRVSIPCRDLIDEAKNYLLLPGVRSLPCPFQIQPRYFKNSDRLYVLLSSKDAKYSIKYYNNDSNKWVTSSEGSDNKNINHVVSVEDKIYTFGDKFELFSVKTKKWASFASDQPVSFGSSVVVHQGRIYVFGGAFDGSTSSVVRCFDPDNQNWSDVSGMVTHRSFASAVSLDCCIYVFGGQNGNVVLNSVENFNPQTREWIELSPMLTRRFRHCSTTQSGKIFACGGYDDCYSICNTVEVYDPCSEQWCFATPTRTVGPVLHVVSCNQRLHAIEECFSNSFQVACNLYVYNLALKKWEFHGPIPGEHVFRGFGGAAIVSSLYDAK